VKRWIIKKDMLSCEDHSCDGYSVHGSCKVLKIEEDGSFEKVCRQCKAKVRRDGQSRAYEFKDRRPCDNPKCKHVRDVTVSVFGLVHGDRFDQKERWEKFCDACRLEQSAANHYTQAREFFKRAEVIRAKRKKIFDTEAA
jgi:hypothetical protein